MATTTITTASFQLALAECADAIEAQDFVTAKRKYAKAEAISMGLEEEVADAGSSVRRRVSLEKLNVAIDAAARNSTNGATDFTRGRSL